VTVVDVGYHLDLLLPNTLKLLGFLIFWYWASPDDGYSRIASCALYL